MPEVARKAEVKTEKSAEMPELKPRARERKTLAATRMSGRPNRQNMIIAGQIFRLWRFCFL